MMTSNRPLEDWGKLIGDVPAATAILDRFLHHAEIIQITGKSYRLRNHAQPGREAEDGLSSAKAPLRGDKAKPASAEGGAPSSKQATPEGGAHGSK